MKTADITDLEVVQAVHDAQEDGSYPYTHLEQRRAAPSKVAYAALERACKRGYIEYGVSLRTGWLTPKGKALIAHGAPGPWETAYEPNGYPRKDTPEWHEWMRLRTAGG